MPPASHPRRALQVPQVVVDVPAGPYPRQVDQLLDGTNALVDGAEQSEPDRVAECGTDYPVLTAESSLGTTIPLLIAVQPSSIPDRRRHRRASSRQGDRGVAEVMMEVALGGEMGVIVAKGTAEVSFVVKLTWRK